MRTRTSCLGVVCVGLLSFAAADRLEAQAQDPELVAAFIFGSRMLDCEVPNGDGESYTVVFQGSDAQLLYDPARGWGYEELNPGAGGVARFGNSFDDSPNNRNAFSDACPEEIYDSFIGAKNFAAICSDPFEPDVPCSELGIEPEGIIFRADVCNGSYRFVAVVGSSTNDHAHRILAENGGEGPPIDISDEHVVLVNNYDQGERGAGTFAHVGFEDHFAPEAIGPGLTSMDSDGFAIEDEDPESPVLEVTEGYIRIHQLQGNNWTGTDGNGGNMVLLELWRVEGEGPCDRGLPCTARREFSSSRYEPGGTVSVTVSAANIRGATTITETFPAGWTVSDAGGGNVTGNTISFEITDDTEVTYELTAPPGFCEGIEISGTVDGAADCSGDVGGSSQIACLDIPPVPADALVLDFDDEGPVDTIELADFFDFYGVDPDLWTVDPNFANPSNDTSALHTTSNGEMLEEFFSRAAILKADVFEAENVYFSVDITWDDNDNSGVFVRFNGENPADPLGNDYYHVRVDVDDGPPSHVYLYRVRDGLSELLLTAPPNEPLTVDQGDTHTVTVVARGEEIAVLIDDLPVPGMSPFLDPDPLEGPGRVGVGHNTNPSYYDDFVIGDLDTAPDGALLRPGDANGDGNFNISDAVAQLNFQFGSGDIPECYVIPGSDPKELNETGRAVLDFNGDGTSNISDPVAGLGALFGGGDGHVLGEACVRIPGTCEDTCQ